MSSPHGPPSEARRKQLAELMAELKELDEEAWTEMKDMLRVTRPRTHAEFGGTIAFVGKVIQTVVWEEARKSVPRGTDHEDHEEGGDR